jgi:hypothetical protein
MEFNAFILLKLIKYIDKLNKIEYKVKKGAVFWQVKKILIPRKNF